jgi:hypothetical protein
MGIRNKSGQILSEALFIILLFAGIFLSIQAILEKHKVRSNENKLSKETKYEFKTTIKKE